MIGERSVTMVTIELYIGDRLLNLFEAPEEELRQATFMMLVFTNQKNARRGEKTGHVPSEDKDMCPINAVVSRIMYLRVFGSEKGTKMHMYRGRNNN